jgi:hypothetical protein
MENKYITKVTRNEDIEECYEKGPDVISATYEGEIF